MGRIILSDVYDGLRGMYNYTKIEHPASYKGSLGFLKAEQLLLLNRKGVSGQLTVLPITWQEQGACLTQEPGRTDTRLHTSFGGGKPESTIHLSGAKTEEWIRERLLGAHLMKAALASSAIALRDDWASAGRMGEETPYVQSLQERLQALQKEARASRHSVATITPPLLHELISIR